MKALLMLPEKNNIQWLKAAKEFMKMLETFSNTKYFPNVKFFEWYLHLPCW